MPYALIGEIDGKSVRLELREGSQLLGRSSDVGLRLDHRSVSRHHASIAVSGDRVTVTDLGSRNGTCVDGARIAGPTELRIGASIAFADAVLTLAGEGRERAQALALNGTAVVTSSVRLSEIYGEVPRAGARGTDLFRVLADAGQFLVSDRPLAELYDDVLDLVERAVPCERVVVLSVPDGTSEPTVLARRGGRAWTDAGLVLSRTMVRQVLHDGASLLTADAQDDTRFRESASVISQGIRAAMAAPLFDNHRIIGLLYADTRDPGTRCGQDELRAFTVLANLIAVKITQARLSEVEEEKKRLDRELAAAHDILGNILPGAVSGATGYELAVLYEPCTEVGGDLYDVRHIDDGRTVVMAGDVAGKGLGAAILVSSIVPVTQVLVGGEKPLVEAMETLNRRMCASTDAVRYATLFVGILDRESGRLEYVNAGHNPPLLIGASGEVAEIPATSVPVGMLEAAPFASAAVTLEPGAVLAVFSDGITEAVGPAGDFYETARLTRVLRDARTEPLDSIVAALRADLRSFTQDTPPSDDITLLLVRRS